MEEEKSFAAFLRGINISGKNKIPMTELKKGIEKLGLEGVKTYLNSGNVVFSSEEDDTDRLAGQIEGMVQDEFGLEVPVFVISSEELEDILQHAPDWWDDENKDIYDNLIFILPPLTFTDVLREIGEPKEGLERVMDYKNAVFWSFVRKDYQKTNWWSKTASSDIAGKLTIRTANTVRKTAGAFSR